MATVNIGNIKLNWKGAYNGSTAYAIMTLFRTMVRLMFVKLQQETFQL